MSKVPTTVDVAQAPAPRRKFNTHYLDALAAKAKPRRKRKFFIVVRCKTFSGGLKALLRAFGEPA